LTSVSEGLPVVVLEYGLYSKPVIVTAVGELPELIIKVFFTRRRKILVRPIYYGKPTKPPE
jgi:glycosyltransferase involved in cell wall biosynthesis